MTHEPYADSINCIEIDFRYYPALKTLEHLEYVLLPRVSNFRFCAEISSSVPKLRQAIRDASMTDLTDFLENIRKYTPKIGFKAQQQTHDILGRDLATIIKNSNGIIPF